METSAIDELYGDLDQDRYDSGLNYDEDSVDIYSGLEDSPKSKGKSGKDQTFFSPQRLKDSMDLYEELITKEQVEKEATYSELKSKFDAAQNQVQELLAKLQQTETKNSILHKENTLLKKNICALIKTAKMEIIRKDEEISKLSKRSNRGIFHISGLDRSHSSINLSGPSRGCQDFRGVVGSRSANKADESSVPLNTPSSVGMTQRCTRNNSVSVNSQSIDPSSVPHAPNTKHAQSGLLSQSRDGVNMASETAPDITRTCKDGRDGGKENLTRHLSRQISSGSDLKEQDLLEKPQSNPDNNRAKKAQSATRSKSSEVQHQQDDPVLPRRSGRSKSPASHTPLPSSSRRYSQSSKGHSRMETDTPDEFQHKQREEKQSEKLETSKKGSFEELDRSTKIKGTREHHRKEERRLEDVSILDKRHTRTDGIKQRESKNMQGNERKIQQNGGSSRGDKKSTGFDTRTEHVRSGAKECDTEKKVIERQPKEGKERSRGDVPVSRRNASPVKTDPRKVHDKRKSSKIVEELSRSKASSSRDDSRGAEGSTKEPASSHDDSRGAEGSTEEAARSCDDSRGAEGSTEEAARSCDDSRGAVGSTEEAARSRDSRGAEGSTEEAARSCDNSRGAQSSFEEPLLRSKAYSCNNDSRGTQISTEDQLSKSKASTSRDNSRSGKICTEEAARNRGDFRGAQSSSKEQFPKGKASSSCDDFGGAQSSTEELLLKSKALNSRDGSRSGRIATEEPLSRSKASSIRGGSRTGKSTTEEELSRSKASDSCEVSRNGKKKSEEKFSMGKSSSSHNGSRSGKGSFEEQLLRSRTSGRSNSSKGGENSATHSSHSSTDKGTSTDSEKGRSKGYRGSKKSARSSSSDKSKTGRDCDVSESTKRKSPVTTSSSDVPSMPLEESPNRKLSFMETLNLTLSPIKNQNLLHTFKESGKQDEAIVCNSVKQASFELGEEFCVIAENTQESTEAIEAAILPLDPSNISTQCSQGHDVPTVSTEPPTCQDEKVMEQESELNNLASNSLSSKAKISEKRSMDSEMQEIEFITEGKCVDESASKIHPTMPQSVPNKIVASVVPLPEVLEPVDGPVSLGNLCQGHNRILVENQIAGSCRLSEEAQVYNKPESAPLVQGHPIYSESAVLNTTSKSCTGFHTSASLEMVSSTVSVDAIQTVLNINTSGGLEKPTKPLERSSSEETLSVCSTIREDKIPSEQIGSSEPDSTEDEMNNLNPSGSVFVQHDEDSMMLTLSNIKVIPEAISPLTSPVRQIKKTQHQRSAREQHVKTLSKDFSTCTIDKAAVQMDMNKENKRPDLPVTPSTELEQEALTSSATQDSLEEGEIISESDEERALVIQSPPVRNRSSSRIYPSPKSPGLSKTNKIKTAVTPSRSEQGKNTTSAESPASSKRRFKTVTVSSKSNISSAIEFMNTLSYIRAELRRKYMKLHRNFTKTAFRSIIDMSLASFTEFVDTVNFHKFCSQEKEIKPRLNKIIATVMSKVSNNGIVNRIFEQKADDLKQKLWTFVDGQFDFLFKEVKAELKSVSDPSRIKSSNLRVTEDMNTAVCKIQSKEPLSMAENATRTNQTTTLHSLQFRARGLGSSGKNIKATMEMVDEQPSILPAAVSILEKPFHETVPVQEQACTLTRRLSHNASIQDRSDFEILTEQQASSLTFNLATDSQMGDIFRCLLQGSDLLEAGVPVGDNQNWQLNTPRKEGMSAESLIGVMTPSKIVTPFKLGMTWPPISPYKFTSPNSKFQLSVNPALLDESCMLEVPSNAIPNQAVPSLTSVNSHKSYSVLAEDLAVSLTIPSPLKSEDHLSFLTPSNVKMLSTPSSVISAHYSEDALLEGEDATVQDIHLSLDTDNSSCTSSTGGPWEPQGSAIFQVKPNLPMQAEVMERSNDHFIVRIRHAGVHEDLTLVETEPLQEAQSALQDNALSTTAQPLVTSICQSEPQVQVSTKGVLFNSVFEGSPQHSENQAEQATVNPDANWDSTSTDPPTSLASADCKKRPATVSEDNGVDSLPECHKKTRKRKKHHSGSRAKRSRREKSQDRLEKERPKKRSKSSKEKSHKIHSQNNPSPQLSPNSLSAKNIIRKKGEVVVTWTREEDRDILVELKLKGLSSKTFATLSSKLRKSQGQIEERVNQLMKLLKKKEKMES